MHTLTPRDILLIAAKAYADPRTVKRYLSGATLRPGVTGRIERAMKVMKIAKPAPSSAQPAPAPPEQNAAA